MRTKLLLLLLVSFVVTGAKSQDNQEIVDYYNLKIDELVDKCQTISDDYDEEKTNPVYAKLAEIIEAHNGLWNAEAEKYLLANAKSI